MSVVKINGVELTLSECDVIKSALDSSTVHWSTVAKSDWYSDKYREECATNAVIADELLKKLS